MLLVVEQADRPGALDPVLAPAAGFVRDLVLVERVPNGRWNVLALAEVDPLPAVDEVVDLGEGLGVEGRHGGSPRRAGGEF